MTISYTFTVPYKEGEVEVDYDYHIPNKDVVSDYKEYMASQPSDIRTLMREYGYDPDDAYDIVSWAEDDDDFCDWARETFRDVAYDACLSDPNTYDFLS